MFDLNTKCYNEISDVPSPGGEQLRYGCFALVCLLLSSSSSLFYIIYCCIVYPLPPRGFGKPIIVRRGTNKLKLIIKSAVLRNIIQ